MSLKNIELKQCLLSTPLFKCQYLCRWVMSNDKFVDMDKGCGKSTRPEGTNQVGIIYYIILLCTIWGPRAIINKGLGVLYFWTYKLYTYHSRLKYLSPQQWSVLNELRGPYSAVLSSLVNRTPEYSRCASSTSGNKLSSQYAAEPPRTTEVVTNNSGSSSEPRPTGIFVNCNHCGLDELCDEEKP